MARGQPAVVAAEGGPGACGRTMRHAAGSRDAQSYHARLARGSAPAPLRPAITSGRVVSGTPACRRQVGALRCFRGVATVTGLAVASGLFDVRRFPTPAHVAG
jgi:hypothetical protein